MQVGQMRERIEVQRPSESRSVLGEVTQSWQTYETRWASVLSLSSRELLNAQQQALTVTHKVRMRHLPGLKATDRLLWRGRTLHIVSVVEYDNLSVHELLCEERT